MKIYSKLFSASILLSLIASSCYYDNKETIYKNVPSVPCDTNNITYSDDISAIFSANCTTSDCHGGNNPKAGLDLTDYDNAVSKSSEIAKRVTEKTMPPGAPLPDCEISKIDLWVKDGTPN